MAKLREIKVSPFSVSFFLGLGALFLSFLSTLGQLGKCLLANNFMDRIANFFYLGSERNLPTYFSVFLLLFSSFILILIACLKKQDQDSFWLSWTVLTLGFFLMAADELFCFHERLIDPIRQVLGNRKLGIFYYAWVIPAIIFVVVSGFFFFKFLFSLPSKIKYIFYASSFIYLFGAIGFELIEGYYIETYQSEDALFATMAPARRRRWPSRCTPGCSCA